MFPTVTWPIRELSSLTSVSCQVATSPMTVSEGSAPLDTREAHPAQPD
jgi:hypothetical protein